MDDKTHSEVIITIRKIINIIEENSNSVKLSLISTFFIKYGIKKPMWKKYEMTLTEFINKFPNILNLDSLNETVSFKNKNISDEQIIEDWNYFEDDIIKYNKKFNINLIPFILPEDILINVTDNEDICNKWIENNIYSKNIKIIGFDVESTIPEKNKINLKKPSILQISTQNDNLIIQLSKMTELPIKLIDLFEDNFITKLGVNIELDFKLMNPFLKNLYKVNNILDLSILTKGLNISSPIKESFSLRDLAAIFLNKFLNNKGYSEIKKTNWDDLVLSQEQINYAITDSYIAILIFNEMEKNIDIAQFQMCLESTKINLLFEKIDQNQYENNLINKQQLKLENKQKIKEREESTIKINIDRKIKKWFKNIDDISELEFEPMNSYYRNYIHNVIKKNNNIESFSIGLEKDFTRRVLLKKLK